MKKHTSNNFQRLTFRVTSVSVITTIPLYSFFFFLPYWRCMKEHTSLWLMPVKHSSPAAPLMETQVRIIIRVPDWWGWLLSYFKYGKFSGSDCGLFVYFFGIQCKQKGADHPPCFWAFWYIRVEDVWRDLPLFSFDFTPPHSVFCIH